MKFEPFTVKVKPLPPAHWVPGEISLMAGTGLSTVNALLVPVSLPLVRVAVRVTLAAPGLIVTLCDAKTPDTNSAVVPLPEDNVPLLLMPTVYPDPS